MHSHALLAASNADPGTGIASRMMMLVLSVAVLLCAWLPASADAQQAQPSPIHQLRIYEIFDDTKGAFHERFRDHAARIMARHGFRILAMWETRHQDRTEFVYLLEWPDLATKETQWAAFMADQEWSDIKASTRALGPMVGEIEDRTLLPVPYSPALGGRE
jgi:hypothetical protein